MSIEERTRRAVENEIDRLRAVDAGLRTVETEHERPPGAIAGVDPYDGADHFGGGGIALVRDADALDAVLLVRDADRPDRWELPGGGREPGEDVRAAAIRECREETGYRPRLVAPLACHHDVLIDGGTGDRAHYLGVFYLGEIAGGTRSLPDEEIVAARWVPVDDPPSGVDSVAAACCDRLAGDD
ncbi:hypothetical protein BRD17_01910 [Halobacteriales archaeon SW_7_68_16]|nr:MAG: hypothetical protein BRD17_01910 [Halobacteriales archaeon SW_7_68_16]